MNDIFHGAGVSSSLISPKQQVGVKVLHRHAVDCVKNTVLTLGSLQSSVPESYLAFDPVRPTVHVYKYFGDKMGWSWEL